MDDLPPELSFCVGHGFPSLRGAEELLLFGAGKLLELPKAIQGSFPLLLRNTLERRRGRCQARAVGLTQALKRARAHFVVEHESLDAVEYLLAPRFRHFVPQREFLFGLCPRMRREVRE